MKRVLPFTTMLRLWPEKRNRTSRKRRGYGDGLLDGLKVAIVEDNSRANQVVHRARHSLGNYVIDDDQELVDDGKNIERANLPNLDVETSDVVDQSSLADGAWVCCDGCHKWRRIPASLVDSAGQSQWFCKDNVDRKFANCSIPQEKTNEEIDAELDKLDAEEGVCGVPSNHKGAKDSVATVPKECDFTHITTNQFLHRNRKTQTIDEVMVCNCKPPAHANFGCGEECLNRMLNIECVRGTCPCADLCSNQQFQNRNYAKMRRACCGMKGFGLRVEEDISEGRFLIEYVGEVLDRNTYEARQKEYASKGHKHFYFMTLNGDEVIDACAKGNLARFINHSCDPNCRAEKWDVNGEIRIGIFAIRDIKKDEEVTFDYNYVKVFGVAAKRCDCGSWKCQGFIGGDPTSCEVIYQVDLDEEFTEPLMLGDEEDGNNLKNAVSKIKYADGLQMENAEIVTKDQDEMIEPSTASDKPKVANDKDSVELAVSAEYHFLNSVKVDNLKENGPLSNATVAPSTEAEISSKSSLIVQQDLQETSSTTTNAAQISETPSTKMLYELSLNGLFVNKKLESAEPDHKRSRQSESTKKVEVCTNPPKANEAHIMTRKSQAMFMEPKGLPETISDGRFDSVEEKLNELLDTDGGIRNQKDAHEGYLKLLLLTDTSGASGHGQAFQSNRDLSMILDALLKTRSQTALMNIISRKGLQMLHNMMKQYREDLRKIPVLRKLLRVLEHLAVREILSLEQINGGPPCPGMESFQESMLSLTDHDDKVIRQLARNFRDKYIPRHLRRHSHREKYDMRAEFHKGSNCNKVSAPSNHPRDEIVRPTDVIRYAAQSIPGTSRASSVATFERNCEPSVSDGTKARKRKSHWDQDSPVSRSLRHDEKKIKRSESLETSQKVHHQFARNFRDKWISRHLRRYSHKEKDDMKTEFHKGSNYSKVSPKNSYWCDKVVKPTDAISYAAQSNLRTSQANSVATFERNCEPCVSDGNKSRKRKSHWDQDSPISKSSRHDEKKIKK